MLHKEEYSADLPPMKASRRLQPIKQEQPMASDDSRLSEDSNAEVPLGSGMMLLLEACEKLAEEDCTAETRPALGRRASSTRRRTTIDYGTGYTTTDTKTQTQKTGTKRRSRTELHGPCCHCGATESPQWRKGPMCKPVLCNACGTRFLRTRSLGKVVIGRNGRRYAKEEPPAEEATCESSIGAPSAGSTDDAQPIHAAPVRRDSRLGLSRPTKTRRLDLPDPTPPTQAPRTASPSKPTHRHRTTMAAPKPPTQAPPSGIYLPSASSASSPAPAPLPLPAHHHPYPSHGHGLLLQQLLAPAALHHHHQATPFFLPTTPHQDAGFGATPLASAAAAAAASHYAAQHLQGLKQHLAGLHQAAADCAPVYLHVQAGPLS